MQCKLLLGELLHARYCLSRPVALYGPGSSTLTCAQAVGPVAVTSLLLGEGLPKVVGLPEQEDPNNPEEPDIQAVYNRTAIQACRASALGTRSSLSRSRFPTLSLLVSNPPTPRRTSGTQHAAQQLCLAGVCLARHMYISLSGCQLGGGQGVPVHASVDGIRNLRHLTIHPVMNPIFLLDVHGMSVGRVRRWHSWRGALHTLTLTLVIESSILLCVHGTSAGRVPQVAFLAECLYTCSVNLTLALYTNPTFPYICGTSIAVYAGGIPGGVPVHAGGRAAAGLAHQLPVALSHLRVHDRRLRHHWPVSGALRSLANAPRMTNVLLMATCTHTGLQKSHG